MRSDGARKLGITPKALNAARYGGTMGVITGFAVLVLILPSISLATVTFEFEYIPSLDSIGLTDAGIGEAQLFMDIEDGPEAGPVEFTFRNTGPLASVISGIYFEADQYLGSSTILENPPSIDFDREDSPPTLPGDDEIFFIVSFGFMSEPPTSKKGVGPGEEVGISFALINGGTRTKVIAELNDGIFRVGISAIGFEDEGSDSFVNVPEPATVILLGLGSLALVRLRRRRA